MASRIILFLCFTFFYSVPAIAVDVRYQAVVSKIVEEKTVEYLGTPQTYQKLELTIVSADRQNSVVVVENGLQPLANVIQYQQNDRVYITENQGSFQIVDFVRHDALLLLFVIFVVLTVVIAKRKGLFSLFSMALSFLVLFWLILPQIASGKNPILISLIGSIIIIPVSFYMSHGLNRKTTVAIIGSLISLAITCILASIFIKLSHLTGFSSEEAGMLAIGREGSLNMKNLLLSGIVVGVLGVLDDITVSQSAIADELSKVGKFKSVSQLYYRTMIIGTDHITSMVNTLVLAYAGVSLPLLLMFVDNPQPIIELLNNEMIAEEIVRTLVGSIGLIIAVPITTIIAAKWFHR